MNDTTYDMNQVIDEDILGSEVDDYMFNNNLRFNRRYRYLADDCNVFDLADALFEAGDEWTMETAIRELCN